MTDSGIIAELISLYFVAGAILESLSMALQFTQITPDATALTQLLYEYLFRICMPDPVQIILTVIFTLFAESRG